MSTKTKAPDGSRQKFARVWLMGDCGVQSQRSGSARRRQRRSVNQRFLLAMTDMGIPADKAELALYETGNVGVEASPLPSHHSRERCGMQHPISCTR